MILIGTDEFKKANKDYIEVNDENIWKIKKLNKKGTLLYRDYMENMERTEDIKGIELDFI